MVLHPRPTAATHQTTMAAQVLTRLLQVFQPSQATVETAATVVVVAAAAAAHPSRRKQVIIPQSQRLAARQAQQVQAVQAVQARQAWQ